MLNALKMVIVDLSLFLLPLAAVFSQDQETQLKAWEPDTTIVDSLGDYAGFSSFEIRPPKEFQQVSPPSSPKGIELVAWHGPVRKDLTRPMVQVMVLTPPEGEPIPSLEVALEKMLGGIKRRRTDFNQTDTEYGTINGLKFARVEWSGKESNTGTAVRGVKFVAIDGSRIIDMSVQDPESYFDDASKLGIASMLTVRKRN